MSFSGKNLINDNEIKQDYNQKLKIDCLNQKKDKLFKSALQIQDDLKFFLEKYYPKIFNNDYKGSLFGKNHFQKFKKPLAIELYELSQVNLQSYGAIDLFIRNIMEFKKVNYEYDHSAVRSILTDKLPGGNLGKILNVIYKKCELLSISLEKYKNKMEMHYDLENKIYRESKAFFMGVFEKNEKIYEHMSKTLENPTYHELEFIRLREKYYSDGYNNIFDDCDIEKLQKDKDQCLKEYDEHFLEIEKNYISIDILNFTKANVNLDKVSLVKLLLKRSALRSFVDNIIFQEKAIIYRWWLCERLSDNNINCNLIKELYEMNMNNGYDVSLFNNHLLVNQLRNLLMEFKEIDIEDIGRHIERSLSIYDQHLQKLCNQFNSFWCKFSSSDERFAKGFERYQWDTQFKKFFNETLVNKYKEIEKLENYIDVNLFVRDKIHQAAVLVKKNVNIIELNDEVNEKLNFKKNRLYSDQELKKIDQYLNDKVDDSSFMFQLMDYALNEVCALDDITSLVCPTHVDHKKNKLL